jgi:hypothetical protein
MYEIDSGMSIDDSTTNLFQLIKNLFSKKELNNWTDLHNDNINSGGQGFLYNQQFSIRNIGSDGAGNDVIQSRVKIDGRGNVGINLEETEMSDYNYRLTVHGGISAKGSVLALSSSTFHGDLILNNGDLKIKNPTYNSENAMTFSQADSRYTVLSAIYKNSDSAISVNSDTTYFDPTHRIFLNTGTYFLDSRCIINVNSTNGIKTRFRSVGAGSVSLHLTETFYRPAAIPLLPLSAIDITSLPSTNTRLPISVASDYIFDFKGMVEITTAPVVLEFVFANGSVGTQTITLKKYSYIKAEKIG